MTRPDWHDRLRSAVDRSGKNQNTIAMDAGVTPAAFSRILNARVNPRFDTVVRIAQALDVRLGWLVGEPAGLELTAEDERMLRTVLTLVENVTSAFEQGRSITFALTNKK
jgi:transcriptional regulator with XRE-family HTH domain